MASFTGEQHLAYWATRLRKPTKFVYVIRPKGDTPIKIGWTAKDVRRRMADLQTGNPRPLELLYIVPGDYGLEWNLHKLYWRDRKVGEWFEPQDPEAFFTFVADLAQRMVDGYKAGTGNPPDWRDFGEWKRRYDPPKREPAPFGESPGLRDMPAAVSEEEAKARLIAHWTRPASTGHPWDHSGRPGTLN